MEDNKIIILKHSPELYVPLPFIDFPNYMIMLLIPKAYKIPEDLNKVGRVVDSTVLDDKWTELDEEIEVKDIDITRYTLYKLYGYFMILSRIQSIEESIIYEYVDRIIAYNKEYGEVVIVRKPIRHPSDYPPSVDISSCCQIALMIPKEYKLPQDIESKGKFVEKIKACRWRDIDGVGLYMDITGFNIFLFTDPLLILDEETSDKRMLYEYVDKIIAYNKQNYETRLQSI